MKTTAQTFLQLKEAKNKFISLTAYSYPVAKILDEVGVPLVLVGDSLGQVELGYPDTTSVTIEDMIHHGKAVVRGCEQAFVVIDMPFMQIGVDIASDLKAIRKVIQETGANAVKIEGASWTILQTIKQSVELGVPVLGHIGLQPQQIKKIGKFRMVGKTDDDAQLLIQQAYDLEKAGAFAVVLECIAPDVAKKITEQITIPTIGIGSGEDCDGQVLVINDLIGLNGKPPKHATMQANVKNIIAWAVEKWMREVERG